MRREGDPRTALLARVVDPLDGAARDEVRQVLALRHGIALGADRRHHGARPDVVRVRPVEVDRRADALGAGRGEGAVGAEEWRRAHRHRRERIHILDAGAVGIARRAAREEPEHAAAVVASLRDLTADRRVDRGRQIPVSVVEVEPDRRDGRLVAVARGRVLGAAAEVVLPEHARDVALLAQELRHRHLVGMELDGRQHRVDDRGDHVRPDAVASGQHRRARGRALGRRPEVPEAHALRGDLGEDGHRGRLGRGVPAERRERHLVDAEVVEDDDEDVGRGRDAAARRGGVGAAGGRASGDPCAGGRRLARALRRRDGRRLVGEDGREERGGRGGKHGSPGGLRRERHTPPEGWRRGMRSKGSVRRRSGRAHRG